MDPLSQAFSNLFSGVAKSVGVTAAKAAASNPEVQSAISDIEARFDKAQTALTIAAVVAGTVVLFYFVPRFESPIPRVFRGRR